jgi:hypothetical protein
MTEAQRVSEPMRAVIRPAAKIKISVTLSRQQYEMLKELADDQNIDTADALRKAIVTEDFIKAQIKAGKKILIQDRNNSIQEIVFR